MVEGEGVLDGEAFAWGVVRGFWGGFGGDAEAAGDILVGGDAELALVAVRNAEDDFLEDGALEIAMRINRLEGGEGGEDTGIHGEGLDHLGDGQTFCE